MTLTLSGADIRGYYHALGIALPGWASSEASVRCFADPDAHRRSDRDPSCSVNLDHGAWHCHGCGARGGAFDAATAHGYSDRAAIDLMVAYGLTEYRAYRRDRRDRPIARQFAAPRRVQRWQPTLAVGEPDVASWQAALWRDTDRIEQLAETRGWHAKAIRELGLGLARGRITIPIRDRDGGLQAVLRYRPNARGAGPKMIALPGSRLGLIPHPARERSRQIVLTEGPPDMIAGRSIGMPAIAVPGDHAWQSAWARWFLGREVTILVHSDRQGRAAGARAAGDLERVAQNVTVVDLAPEREDGYDLTDWLLDGESSAGVLSVPRAGVPRYARR